MIFVKETFSDDASFNFWFSYTYALQYKDKPFDILIDANSVTVMDE